MHSSLIIQKIRVLENKETGARKYGEARAWRCPDQLRLSGVWGGGRDRAGSVSHYLWHSLRLGPPEVQAKVLHGGRAACAGERDVRAAPSGWTTG